MYLAHMPVIDQHGRLRMVGGFAELGGPILLIMKGTRPLRGQP